MIAMSRDAHARPQGTSEEPLYDAVYLVRQPNPAYYADFRDFSFWSLDVESVRYIGGYGRVSWVEAKEWASAAPDPVASDAPAIDRHGFEMTALTPAGPRPIRLAFPASIASKTDARAALVALLKQARAKLAST